MKKVAKIIVTFFLRHLEKKGMLIVICAMAIKNA
jgi:hypothetical protein